MSPAADSRDESTAWLSSYTIESWPIVVAVPNVEGPFENVDDFRRRSLAKSDRQMRVYAPLGNTKLRIVVPEHYAVALDAVRNLRAVIEGFAGSDAPPNAELDAMLLQRALPEDIVRQLPFIPPTDVLTTIILRDDRNPADGWYNQELDDRAFVSAASANDKTITLFCVLRDEFLHDTVFHELAHLSGERYEIEFGWFAIAAAVESGEYVQRGRAAISVAEDWAVHRGECVMGANERLFAQFCERAPIRAAALGMLMTRLLDNATVGDSAGSLALNNSSAEVSIALLQQRTTILNTVVRAQAMSALRVRIAQCNIANESDRDLLLLLLVMADGSPLDGFASRTIVDVRSAAVGRRVLQSLSAFTSLESLDVSGTFISRGGLEALPALASLRRLDIANTQIFTSDVQLIAELPHLEWLNLGGTNVNVNALPVIVRMQSLRFLCVSGTELAESADDLRVAMPGCEIVA